MVSWIHFFTLQRCLSHYSCSYDEFGSRSGHFSSVFLADPIYLVTPLIRQDLNSHQFLLRNQSNSYPPHSRPPLSSCQPLCLIDAYHSAEKVGHQLGSGCNLPACAGEPEDSFELG